MNRTRKLLAVAGIGLMLAGAGCGSNQNSGDSNDKRTATSGGGAAQSDSGKAAAPGELSQPQAPNQVNGQAPVFDRAIIYTGQITVRVDHVDVSAEQVRALAVSSGGFVGSEKSSSGNGSQDQSVITIRVPAAKFGDILNQLGKIGRELDRAVSTDDVTEQVADLDAQITATRTSVESVRRLLTQAKDLNQILQLEKELTARQATLDSLVGKKRRLDEQVALSTVTVTLIGPSTPYVEPKSEDPSFLGGLRRGWSTFVVILKVTSAVVGFLLPFLIVIAVVGVPAVWWWRRKQRPATGPAE
jgi:Domain of unknown function (DUF4349)